jgi:hypothetical protein
MASSSTVMTTSTYLKLLVDSCNFELTLIVTRGIHLDTEAGELFLLIKQPPPNSRFRISIVATLSGKQIIRSRWKLEPNSKSDLTWRMRFIAKQQTDMVWRGI